MHYMSTHLNILCTSPVSLLKVLLAAAIRRRCVNARRLVLWTSVLPERIDNKVAAIMRSSVGTTVWIIGLYRTGGLNSAGHASSLIYMLNLFTSLRCHFQAVPRGRAAVRPIM